MNERVDNNLLEVPTDLGTFKTQGVYTATSSKAGIIKLLILSHLLGITFPISPMAPQLGEEGGILLNPPTPTKCKEIRVSELKRHTVFQLYELEEKFTPRRRVMKCEGAKNIKKIPKLSVAWRGKKVTCKGTLESESNRISSLNGNRDRRNQ